ncbi:MAG: DUF502 domain-containing protein [Chlamydiota bacterium]
MKKYFITGLLTLLPLAVTFWVIHFVVNFLTKPFVGLVIDILDSFSIGSFIGSDQFIHTMSQIIILIALFLITFFLGLVARKYFFGQLLRMGDRLIHRIPLVNKVYKTSKEIVQSFFVSNKNSFKQVVMITFPYKGCYCIGLVARESPLTCSEINKEELVSVFIPTTPNPTTGFLVMSSKSDLIYLQMKSDEAIKYIVSCGVIQPEIRVFS